MEMESDSEDAGTIALQVDAELEDNYNRFIARANIREAMSIENFLNPVEEAEILTSMEMLDMEEYLLQTADVNANSELESESEAEEVTEKPLYSELSQQEQITALAMAIAVCERRDMSEKIAGLVEGLREVQRKLRWEQEKAEQERLVQRRITNYF